MGPDRTLRQEPRERGRRQPEQHRARVPARRVASFKMTMRAAAVEERRHCVLAQAPTAAGARCWALLEEAGVPQLPRLNPARQSRVHLAARQELPLPVSVEVGVTPAATSVGAAVELAARPLPVVVDRARQAVATRAVASEVREPQEPATAIHLRPAVAEAGANSAAVEGRLLRRWGVRSR